jgi:hypothetical protein
MQSLHHYKAQPDGYLFNKEYPKFDVVPVSKICHVHTSPIRFIELYGHLIASVEESGMLRIWYMEHTMKQFITIWKLTLEERILSFNLDE